MRGKFGDLVRRARDGDQEGWTLLYQATVKEAYFIARKIAPQREAEDLVQEAYLTAYTKLNTLEEPDKFRSWLNMIVANRCRDYLKKQKPMLFSEVEGEDGPELDWADEHETGMPEVTLDHQETVRLVAQMIGDLPEDQRLCVLLYYREELSVSQIAQALGLSEGTVKSRLNYARQKIKAKVESLEKQGVKLYSMAPMPFLLWLLGCEAQTMELPAGLSVGSGAAISSVGTVSAAGGRAAVGGGKALLQGTAVKIIAGGLAASVAIGGVVYSTSQEKPSNQAEEPQINAALQMDIDAAYEAYERLLTRGITEEGLFIQNYAYVDVDQDQIPELLVTDGDGTEDLPVKAELYLYDSGEAWVAGSAENYYPFYFVNDQYLWSGDENGGVQFQNISGEALYVGYNLWRNDIELGDPVICRNYGDPEPIPEEQFHFYTTLSESGPAVGEGYFVKKAEEILLLENEFSICRGKIFECLFFSVSIPEAWEGLYEAEMESVEQGIVFSVYEKTSREAGWGGCLFEIITLPADQVFSYLPAYEELGISGARGKETRVLAITPTDVQYSPETMESYMNLMNDVAEVIKNNVFVRKR